MGNRRGNQSATGFALGRFALKLILLTLFALVQSLSSLGFGRSLSHLMLLTGMIDVALALMRRERPLSPTLTYWDEAAAFLALVGFVHWLT